MPGCPSSGRPPAFSAVLSTPHRAAAKEASLERKRLPPALGAGRQPPASAVVTDGRAGCLPLKTKYMIHCS